MKVITLNLLNETLNQLTLKEYYSLRKLGTGLISTEVLDIPRNFNIIHIAECDFIFEKDNMYLQLDNTKFLIKKGGKFGSFDLLVRDKNCE